MGETVNFSGIKVDNVTLAEAVARVESLIAAGKPSLVVTPNPEMIVAAQEDVELRALINGADLRVPDGISMVVVKKILGDPLKERVSGIDLMQQLLMVSASKGYKVFFFGSSPGIAEAAAVQAAKNYPGLKVVGSQHGYFRQEEEAKIIEKIKGAKPDLLFVGLGAGRQEKWLAANLTLLGTPVGMGIGGSLDAISGKVKRAPVLAQKLYIEWLYRLLQQPWRWRRQIALIRFLILMFFPRKK
ncbi:MAG: WecB/TagA/CpsF family glycosyltransferase [Candidatus Margulisbacteria bacterium]|nr:WecB/TagA/CpsF family glycosyltransferase [Candidatus Margulisiibacteriota bacterium]MBU1616813.1 WecB/TagA/CpsF family glycosyltransferase [Candidatus Margulisiibacteriota bacterium]MBU1867746.1 WecB/TagA/CpsF family glycosyltransferase [Candidatus Margulisiibacteriota bacterium]